MILRTLPATGMLTILFMLTGCDRQENLTTDFEADRSVSKADLPDFSEYSNVSEKKSEFFSFIKRMVDEANREIMVERDALKTLRDGGNLSELDEEAQNFLQRMSKKYRVENEDTGTLIKRLLNRAAPVPPSLAMAQAANESAWGTSRFAVKGNNLFGQWCFSKGCGIVPGQRPEDAGHEVATYSSPYQSVRSYMLNINRHDAYQELRRIRAEELKQKGYSTGLTLAGGLERYSERGHEYVDELRSMIRYNKLSKYDQPEPVH